LGMAPWSAGISESGGAEERNDDAIFHAGSGERLKDWATKLSTF
jgi:hypothetical protein